MGGAGYIGSNRAGALARRGHEVVIYDNLSTGRRELAKGFELVVGHVGDASTLARALRGADALMHFAAHSLVGESVQNPRKYFENNVRDGLVLLDACMEVGVQQFIFSSTASVYGDPTKVPIIEDAPKEPTDPYGMSKLAFEYAMRSYGDIHVEDLAEATCLPWNTLAAAVPPGSSTWARERVTR